ncbi:unnamed protein product [Darwinula stevensoni]|uniref:beta-N-acetylhexosaminidase n=1 Tax=Darwinula stevensoni TaxID=69355 RepID=A0A7R9FNL8_9CRUS|nr:unnamed protein product [Darwinula stevensoni]CAG0896592.1 unnamed protein product [Darwinula stevensoni]
MNENAISFKLDVPTYIEDNSDVSEDDLNESYGKSTSQPTVPLSPARFSPGSHPSVPQFLVSATSVSDWPRLSWRGLLLDTSRLFLPKTTIFETLDLMAMHKLNVFHRHIVDDHSFSYESARFPFLRSLLNPSARYTQSWGKAMPGLLTACQGASLWKMFLDLPEYGPIDPSREENNAFLRKFFWEVQETFHDRFLHRGGDEVDFLCCTAFVLLVPGLHLLRDTDWENYYKCDPENFPGNTAQKMLVLGGEVCLWGEFPDKTNLLSRLWPRGSAAAERLWSPREAQDADFFASRMNEHRCRLRRRGFPAQPINGPYSCDHLSIP